MDRETAEKIALLKASIIILFIGLGFALDYYNVKYGLIIGFGITFILMTFFTIITLRNK